jgi:carboxylesterase
MIVGRWHTDRWGRLRGTDDGGPIDKPGEHLTFLAFHGFTGTTSEIRPVVDAVAAEGFSVRAPLLPGHGTHPRALQDVRWEDWADAMHAELELAKKRQPENKVVLCGFSLGSLVAMELAARAKDDPALAGLVLLGNAITLNPGLAAALGFLSRASFKLPDWYYVKILPADLRDRGQQKKVTAYDRDPIRAAVEVYRAGTMVHPRLSSITAPTLLLHGGKDRLCPPGNVERVKTAIGARSIETRVFPESAHMVAADVERDEVAREVVRFVTSVSGAQRPVEP